jgi:hypothetical protein
LNGREASVRDFGEGKNAATIVDGPHVVPQVSVTTDTAEVAYEKVLAGAGASLHRDLIDARLIDAVKSLGSAGKIINDESQVGGIGELRAGEAPKDSDGDGIPDAWETAHNLNPNDPSDATASPKGSSYMFLEEYLNSLVH